MSTTHGFRSFPRIEHLVLTAALAIAPLAAQDAPGRDDAPPCQTDTIDWVLPGDFEGAVARAKAERRLILIKGISFGVDEAGAKCATKGKW